jgi:hypothetical protein
MGLFGIGPTPCKCLHLAIWRSILLFWFSVFHIYSELVMLLKLKLKVKGYWLYLYSILTIPMSVLNHGNCRETTFDSRTRTPSHLHSTTCEMWRELGCYIEGPVEEHQYRAPPPSSTNHQLTFFLYTANAPLLPEPSFP